MARTSRLLAALALGLALAGVTAAAAVAQPTPPTIEDHHDQSLRIQKADEVRRALLSCLIELGPTTRR